MREGYHISRLAAPGGPDWRYALITAATPINGAIRFNYTITLGHWDMTQSPETGGMWVAGGAGMTGLTAFSQAEDFNTFTGGTGPIGTGNTNVTQSDGTVNGSSCKLVPLAGYVIVIPRGGGAAGGYWTIVGMASSAQ